MDSTRFFQGEKDIFFIPDAHRYFQKEIFQVFKLLRESTKGVLIHCNLGKDRTGCIVALLQCLLGVSHKEVEAEYVCGGRNAYAFNVKTLLKVVEEFGGIQEFLLGVGLTIEDLEDIKQQLCN